jgi:hypothetical protein
MELSFLLHNYIIYILPYSTYTSLVGKPLVEIRHVAEKLIHLKVFFHMIIVYH